MAISVWRLLNISYCWFIFSALRVAMSVWRLLNISAMFCSNDVICGLTPSRAGCCGLDSRDSWLGLVCIIVGGEFSRDGKVVVCEYVAPLSELVRCSVVQVTLSQM